MAAEEVEEEAAAAATFCRRRRRSHSLARRVRAEERWFQMWCISLPRPAPDEGGNWWASLRCPLILHRPSHWQNASTIDRWSGGGGVEEEWMNESLIE